MKKKTKVFIMIALAVFIAVSLFGLYIYNNSDHIGHIGPAPSDPEKGFSQPLWEGEGKLLEK